MQTEETESHGRVVDVLDRTEPAVAHAIWTQVPVSFKCARVYVDKRSLRLKPSSLV